MIPDTGFQRPDSRNAFARRSGVWHLQSGTWPDDHLSGMFVTKHLVLPTISWDCSGWGLPRSRFATGPWELLPPNFTLTQPLFDPRRRVMCSPTGGLHVTQPFRSKEGLGGIISVALFRGEGFGEQTPRVVCSFPKRLTTPSPCGGQALPATHTPGRAVRPLIGLTHL